MEKAQEKNLKNLKNLKSLRHLLGRIGANDIVLPDKSNKKVKKWLNKKYADKPWEGFPVNLDKAEIDRINACIRANDLNEYGDPINTEYPVGSSPSGDRFQYILSNDYNNNGDPDACDPMPHNGPEQPGPVNGPEVPVAPREPETPISPKIPEDCIFAFCMRV